MKKLFLLGLFVFSVNGYAFFGPDNYEDCILENVKDAKSDAAVGAVYDACATKFPSKTSKENRVKENKLKRRMLKCGLKKNDFSSFVVFRRDTPSTFEVINRIKSMSLSNGSIKFQNNNNFGISLLELGFTKQKKCPSHSEEDIGFSARIACKGWSPNTGVPRGKYGEINCQRVPREILKLNFCIVGFGPTFDRLGEGLISYMEKNKLCKF